MDVSTKKACFDELSHRICDSDLKVSINDISSHWKVNLRDSEALLLDWCAEHSSTEVTKEYLIRGVDRQGHCVISVVPEKRMESARQLFPQFCSSLFSVELPATSERLGVHQLSNGVVINLPLDGKVRAPRAQTANVVSANAPATVKDEKKAVANAKPSMFGQAKKPAVEVKKSPPKPKESPAKVPKVEAITPRKESPKKVSKMPATKSSIASFFAKPSAATKAASNKPVKEEEEEEPMETEESEITMAEPEEEKEVPKKETPAKQTKKQSPAHTSNKKSRKRSVAETQDSDDEENGIPATPQQSNKRVRKEKPADKTSKAPAKIKPSIASSDEDIPGTPEPKKTDKKEPRYRRIVDSDSEDETPTAAASAAADAAPKRRKAKRTVTRMYEDENGFMLSVKEIEEYTCSEDESGEPSEVSVPVEKSPAVATENIPPKKTNAKSPTKKSNAKTPPKAKKITPPKAGNKQGSILSFFSKK